MSSSTLHTPQHNDIDPQKCGEKNPQIIPAAYALRCKFWFVSMLAGYLYAPLRHISTYEAMQALLSRIYPGNSSAGEVSHRTDAGVIQNPGNTGTLGQTDPGKTGGPRQTDLGNTGDPGQTGDMRARVIGVHIRRGIRVMSTRARPTTRTACRHRRTLPRYVNLAPSTARVECLSQAALRRTCCNRSNASCRDTQ